MEYPKVLDPELIGTYPASANADGGYVWDEVLEDRVWCLPEGGAEDHADGGDYYRAVETNGEAKEFSEGNQWADEPLALVLQREYIEEPEPGRHTHIREERVTEWPVEFLSRTRRTAQTIPAFVSPTAPKDRLEILRRTAK